MPNSPLLEVRNIEVHYGQLVALRAVSYQVERNAIVCLLGGNASGKSTSLKAIFGVVPLKAGEIYFKGVRIDRMPTFARVRSGMATVPEGRRLFRRLSVYENILVGAVNRKDRGVIQAEIEEVYSLFPHLAQLRDQQAGTLSGGEQQMVAIARALMGRPELVMMDEPSMGLAPTLVRQSFEVIRTLRERGTSVFVVEQNATAALAVADYAYVLNQGSIMLEGVASDVAQNAMMKEAYLGRTASGVEDLRLGGGGVSSAVSAR